MPRTRMAVLALLAAVAALLSTTLTGTASAATNPSAGPFPPGTNTCKPNALHPYPVVLVHGTFEDAAQNWSALAPYLQAKGYCVYALNYGLRGTQDIHASSLQLKTFIEKFVLPNTGASKVDIVGHSQGGMMPRDYINHSGGNLTVNELVGLSSSNHGTQNPLAPGAVGCVACMQQVYNSPYIQYVNSPTETKSPVDYTVVETRYDEVVVPYTSAFLEAVDNTQVTNVTLQDKCPGNVDDHLATPYDPVVFQWVTNALNDPANPANPAFRPVCV
jgi:triacylglycerol esterase/lipase EstA (alpha/beta hydrolase family)